MKLVTLSNGNFKVILNSATSFEGDKHTVCRYMWHDLDIEAEEIEFALAEMKRLNMNTAHFGNAGIFLCCSDERVVANVVSELKAIRDLRTELARVYKDSDGIVMHDVGTRLLSLYIALNVEALIDIVEHRDEMMAA